ncbi:MAG: YkgJ family cysteine cluster protein [Candidatus Woesearchaeota archaeon]
MNLNQQLEHDPISIIVAARNKLGPYCMNECQAKCCRMGRLLLTSQKQVRVISKGRMRKLYLKKQLTKRTDGGTDLLLHPHGCPALTPSNKCSIFTKKERPKICDEFPLFLRGRTVFAASACPAVKKGMIDTELSKVKKQGLDIIIQ